MENLLERLFFISPGENIDSELITKNLLNITGSTSNIETLPLEEALYAFEKDMIIKAMKKSANVKNRAAKLLGINTSTLYYKLEKYGIK